jgi:hypothetical protein
MPVVDIDKEYWIDQFGMEYMLTKNEAIQYQRFMGRMFYDSKGEAAE